MQSTHIPERLAALRSLMAEHQLDAFVVSKEVNLHYFSGFRGDDTMLVITPSKQFLVTDSRYTEQAHQQAPLYELVEQTAGLLLRTSEVLIAEKAKAIGFEGNALTYDRYAKLKGLLHGRAFETSVDLGVLRQVKDAEEIACIRKACEIADKAFYDVVDYMKPGMTELDVAAHMEAFMRAHGSDGPSFTTIVASGVRGALPHGVATDKVLEDGDFVTMDYGAIYEGYHSDITRTVVIGHASKRQRAVYDAVLHAQELALTLIRPGASGKSVDAAVRAELAKSGLAFGHGLGHSLGLEIHEEPRLSPKSACEALVPGMLITDEPGYYESGWGGLRIEDTVLVTPSGCERFTTSDKRLVEIA